jgi:hypothetical protein
LAVDGVRGELPSVNRDPVDTLAVVDKTGVDGDAVLYDWTLVVHIETAFCLNCGHRPPWRAIYLLKVSICEHCLEQ